MADSPVELDEIMAARLFASPPNKYFRYGGLSQVSVAGHPYMIGVRHVEIAANRFAGRLGEEAIRAAESANYGCRMQTAVRGGFCNLPYSDHIPQTVVRVELAATGLVELGLTGARLDLNKVPGLHEYLLGCKPQLLEHKLAGCIFPTVKEEFDVGCNEPARRDDTPSDHAG